MSTKLLGVAGLLSVAVFAAALLLRAPGSAAAPAAAYGGAAATPQAPMAASIPAGTPASASAPAPASKGYTMAQVAAHSNASSCWTAINGSVYDVTGFIHQHPGGAAAILSLCGRDGSAAFNGQHGGQRRPASELASFYLAPLL